MALRPTGKRRKGAGPTKTALAPADTIGMLRRQVRGWLENATWNNGYSGMQIDPLVSEVYERAGAWVNVFDGRGRVRFFEGWLSKIAELVAKNAIAEYERSKSVVAEPQTGVQVYESPIPDGCETSLDDLLSRRPNTTIFDVLSGNLRVVLGLKIVCNSTNKQIADAIGGTDSSVRTLLGEARARLVETLTDKRMCKLSSRTEPGQEGGRTVGKRNSGPAIIASRLASEVEGIPLRAVPGETVYQNLARASELGNERILAQWVAFFGADSAEAAFRRCCFHKHTANEKAVLSKLNPDQPAKGIAGIGWIEYEVAELTLYALFEQLMMLEGAERKLEELCHLVGCSDPDEFDERLDWSKVASPPREEGATSPPQGGEGTAMPGLPSTNGGRWAADLADYLSFKVPSRVNLVRLHAIITDDQRRELYALVGVDDDEEFGIWAEAGYDQSWEPVVKDEDEDDKDDREDEEDEDRNRDDGGPDEEDEQDDGDEEGGRRGARNSQPRQPLVRRVSGAKAREAREAVATLDMTFEGEFETALPFASLEEFVGRDLSHEEFARLAVTPLSVWSLDHDMTFAHAVYAMYKKHETEDHSGLVHISKLARGEKKGFGQRLPSNVDTMTLLKMKDEEGRRIKATKTSNGQGANHNVHTAVTSSATVPAGAASPVLAGKKEEGAVSQFSWMQASAEGMPGALANELLPAYFTRRWSSCTTEERQQMHEVFARLHPGACDKYAQFSVSARRTMEQYAKQGAQPPAAPAAPATTTTAGHDHCDKPWFAGQQIKGATNWSKMYASPANLVEEGATGSLIELLVAIAEKADPGKATKDLSAFYDAHKDLLPLNLDGAGLVRAVQSYKSRQKKGDSEKAQPKAATPKKAPPPKQQTAEDRKALFAQALAGKFVRPISDGDLLWPAPEADETVEHYIARLKGCGAGMVILADVIIANTSLVDVKFDSRDELYDMIIAIEEIAPPNCIVCGAQMQMGPERVWLCPDAGNHVLLPPEPITCSVCGKTMVSVEDGFVCPNATKHLAPAPSPAVQLELELGLNQFADLLVEVYQSAGNRQAAELVKMTHSLAPEVARAVVLKAVKDALLG